MAVDEAEASGAVADDPEIFEEVWRNGHHTHETARLRRVIAERRRERVVDEIEIVALRRGGHDRVVAVVGRDRDALWDQTTSRPGRSTPPPCGRVRSSHAACARTSCLRSDERTASNASWDPKFTIVPPRALWGARPLHETRERCL